MEKHRVLLLGGSVYLGSQIYHELLQRYCKSFHERLQTRCRQAGWENAIGNDSDKGE
ncbi:hypothetical protein HPY27_23170 [Brevibacillus sp. HB1.1]|uniref:hypothetical protein n=1 Tax=Brevibacillus sp. HB1.1 TaxID=2738808 RepID=UPI001574FCEE|nr:hypothetical protein [Brevibacillus sp. HB1.1]NTU33068.1 hypothetical protein [Brevibacillus sp. HB1.1]